MNESRIRAFLFRSLFSDTLDLVQGLYQFQQRLSFRISVFNGLQKASADMRPATSNLAVQFFIGHVRVSDDCSGVISEQTFCNIPGPGRRKVISCHRRTDSRQSAPQIRLLTLLCPLDQLKPYCLEDLSLAGFDPKKDIAGKSAVVTRANFGCGSSREHAPWVLECNGINIVIAENFARIFRQNMFNCGLMAISLDRAAIDEIFKTFAGIDAELTTDIENRTFTISNGAVTKVYPFTVGEFDLELVKAGGWVNYADSKY